MSHYDQKMSGKTISIALITVLVMVGSLFLVVLFPENIIIQFLLGSGRIFIFWLVLFGLIYIGEFVLNRYKK